MNGVAGIGLCLFGMMEIWELGLLVYERVRGDEKRILDEGHWQHRVRVENL